MEWKDSGERVEKEETPEDGYFDEEQYSPWAGQDDQKKRSKITKLPVLFFLLGSAIVALVIALLMLVSNNNGEMVGQQKVTALEGRIKQLEERLDKYESMDEKVALIWEQAKSFEKFKDRFDRSEASMSLRMDHLTMSLEAMQKQPTTKNTVAVTKKKEAISISPSSKKMQYHHVKAGETLYSISKRYGLKVDGLLKLNKMDTNSVIVVGQKLIVRSAEK